MSGFPKPVRAAGKSNADVTKRGGLTFCGGRHQRSIPYYNNSRELAGRRWRDVVACSDRFDRLDTTCRSDGAGARKIAQDLVLDCRARRAIGTSGAPASRRSKAPRAGNLIRLPSASKNSSFDPLEHNSQFGLGRCKVKLNITRFKMRPQWALAKAGWHVSRFQTGNTVLSRNPRKLEKTLKCLLPGAPFHLEQIFTGRVARMRPFLIPAVARNSKVTRA